MRKNAKYVVISALIAISFLFTGCTKSALDNLKDNIKKNPNNPKAHIDLAYEYSQTKQYDLAIKEYDKTLELRPTDFLAANNKGVLLYQIGKFDEALAIFVPLTVKQPKNSLLWNNIAMCYHKMRKFNEAYVNYKKAIELNPKNTQAVTGMGILKEEMTKMKLAFPPTGAVTPAPASPAAAPAKPAHAGAK